MKHALIVIFVLALAPYAQAKDKDKYAPLPPQIMKAKTVCIQASEADLSDRVYKSLRKWGRFQIVPDCHQAELIFKFSVETHIAGYQTDSQWRQDTSNSAQGKADTSAVVEGSVTLEIVDRATDKPIWRNSQELMMWVSATNELIKNLRKRIESQERER